MRAVFSILGLVVAFAVVMFVMKQQSRELVRPVQLPAAAVAPGVAASMTPAANLPDAVRNQVDAAMEQAAQRASEAQR